EVSAILQLADETATPIVPQGGNTGLVGGQIPHHNEIVLSLNRLDGIREVDPTSYTITCEAGVTLQRAREAAELAEDPMAEAKELAAIYRQRGLDAALAAQVAEQLMTHDALGAHMRDELGIHEAMEAKPVQAAIASAASFAVGAIFPVLMAFLFRGTALVEAVAVATLVLLAVLGATGAYVGGANLWKGALRVLFWGALAMAVTAGIGHVFGTRV
ncbi:MAG: VIT1/CCC1 transporter family protein, partial [Pseudomonadota bacterium]